MRILLSASLRRLVNAAMPPMAACQSVRVTTLADSLMPMTLKNATTKR